MNMQKKSFLASSMKVALYGTTALMATVAAHNVSAQTAEDESADSTEVIEVTGIRGALANAAELKREANTFMDSITASDANALPDLSVAEALSRVPGVTVTKFDIGADGGDFPSAEGSGNLVRGLGLIRSELNGRDAFTADGGRALDWSSIPPQMIEGVDVYKNQTADLIEGGIGGSINLRTIEPFDREGFYGVVSLDGTYSDLREETTPTYSAILSNRWQTDSGEFGLLGSFSRSELKSLFNGYQSGAIVPVPVGSVGGDQFPDFDVEDFTGGVIPQEGQTVGIANGFQLRQTEVDRERSNVYLAGQWKSSDDSVKATVKYVKVTNETFDLERTTEWHDGGNAYEYTTGDSNIIASDITLRPFTSPGVPRCGSGNTGDDPSNFCSQLIPIDGGLFEEGLVSSNLRSWAGTPGLELGNLGIGRHTESESDDLSINVEWQVDDQWFVELDAHRTTAELTRRDQWIGAFQYVDAITRPDLDNPTIEFMQNSGVLINSGVDAGSNVVAAVTPTSTSDPLGAIAPYAADDYRDGSGDSVGIKLDATYEFEDNDWFKSVKFGARRSEREQMYQSAGLNWQQVAPAWGGSARYGAFDTVAHELVDFSNFQRGGVVLGDETSFVYAHSDFLRDPDSYYDFLASEPDLAGAGYSPFSNDRRDANYNEKYTDAQTSDLDETITNFYVRLDISHALDNDMYLDGNIGVRYVKHQIDSVGSYQYSPFGEDEQTNPVEIEPFDNVRDFLPETAAFFDQAPLDRVVSIDDDYYLPSLNLKLELNDEMLIRFGISRGLTLPNVSDLNASQSIAARSSVLFPSTDDLDPDGDVTDLLAGLGAETEGIYITGGNPDLKPTISTNIDLSFEWYGEDDATFSVSLFNKSIKDLVQSNTNVQVDAYSLDGDTIPVFFAGSINQAEADITGVEIAGQYFFDELEGIWSNFGVQANYTHLDVDANPPSTFLDADGDGEADSFDGIIRVDNLNGIIGQSENFANLVGIYQDDKFEVRLAYQYRDEFLNSYETYITGNPNIQDDNFSIDLSMKYQINDNLKVSLQGTNLTDELQTSQDILNNQGQRYQRSSFMFDRRFQFGVQYTF
ncbi:TonB-dependent receptor [Paraglaciecola sp.]|uniref:TonB-dependent receptor n=1 Tax=Paraglaciecola sp. TaxID=1920173 RepID=UPI003EF817A2